MNIEDMLFAENIFYSTHKYAMFPVHLKPFFYDILIPLIFIKLFINL